MDQQEYNRMDELTLNDILQIFKRRKWWLIGITLLVLALTFVYLLYTPPIYQASTTIKISSQSSGFSLSAAALLGGGGGSSDISNKTSLMKSISNYNKLIKDLDLMHNKLFEYKKSTSLLHKMKVLVLGETKIPTNVAVKNNIVKYLNDNISVSPVKQSNVVKITVSSKDPKLATAIANDITKIFMDQQIALDRSTLVRNKSFVDEQISTTEKALNSLYNKVEDFQKKYKVVSLDAQAQYYATTLSNLDTAEYQLANDLADAKKSIEAINKIMNVTYKNIITTNAISNDSVVMKLKNQLLDYNVKLQGMKQIYAVNDPQIKALEAQIEETKKQLKDRISQIVSNTDNSSAGSSGVSGQILNTSLYSSMLQQKIAAELKYQVLQASQEALNKFKNTLESKLEKLPEGIKEYTLLQRDLKTKTAIYSLMIQKSIELELQIQSTDGGIQIIDKAEVPYVPAKPNKSLTLAIGFVLGIFLGILAMFVVEARDKTLKSSYEVQKLLNYRNVIGEIFKTKFENSFTNENKYLSNEELVVFHKPNDSVSESIKLLTSNVDYLRKDGKIIEVSSAFEHSGKTFVSSNMALSLAQTGLKTALVDLNLRTARLDKLFNLRTNKHGVVTYVLKNDSLDDILISNIVDNLDLIPSGPIPQNPTPVIGSYKIKTLMEELRKTYDIIIVDTPNIIGYSDVPIMGKFIDSAVLVIRPSIDTANSISKSKDIVEIAKVNILGYVINNI